MYIYPENLKAAPTLWLWRLRDITIGGTLAVLGAVLLAQFEFYPLAAAAGIYLFLTIRIDDACILDFIRKASIYFLVRPLGVPFSYGGERSSKQFFQQKKEERCGEIKAPAD